ncbi:MAG: amidase [Acidobacteriota bacterium]
MNKLWKMLLIASIVTAMPMVLTPAAPQGAKKAARPNAASKPSVEPTIVEVSSFKFEPKVLTVKVGTMVRWLNKTGWHTIAADNGSFTSTELKGEHAYFDHTFKKAGKFPYHCSFHGNKGGKDMAGTIIVQK